MSIITGVTIHNAKLKHKKQIYRFQRKKTNIWKRIEKIAQGVYKTYAFEIGNFHSI